jgi:isochorismate synthase
MLDVEQPCAVWVEAGQAQLAWGVVEQRCASSLAEGVALVGELSRCVQGPWFGGLAFPAGSTWPGFPAARFIRPERVESMPVAALLAGAEGCAPGTRPRFGGKGGIRAPCSAGVARQAPMDDRWRVLTALALREIATGGLEKVVLARTEELSGEVDAWHTFVALVRSVPAARHYLFRSEQGACFIGATPETLLRLRGGEVEIDALAGSAPLGVAFTEKEHREHQVVVRDVLRALEGLEVDRPQQPRILELPYVRHLHTPMRAPAGVGFDVARVLEQLFPTAAVAGAPRQRALEFIARHEGFARGWYAGAIGRVARGEVDLGVALRCVLIAGPQARLFAGAGVVAGSSPEAEWEEIARKTLPARHALHLATTGRAA